MPIEELEVDDEVLTAPEASPTDPPRVGRVTRVFRNVAAAILWLHLANGQVLGTTPGHEVWTLDDGWTYAAYLEAGDLFIGVDGDLVEIERIVVDPTPTVVYNLEVDGTFTYFAEGVLVHNNSCRRLIKGAFNLIGIKRLPRSALKRGPPKRGLAPIGIDNKSVQIHHVDQGHYGPYVEILKRDHLKIGNPLSGVPADVRAQFEAARRRYWERMWDSGRFNGLPR